MSTPTLRRGSPLRALLVAATIIGATLALTGCVGGETPGGDSTPSAATSDDAFPVTIDAAYGEITVDEKPERIFVFSVRNLVLLSALGEEPYVWNDGSSTLQESTEYYPYLGDFTTTEPDTSLYDMGEYSLDPEAIALLEPDLILADPWNVDEQLYEQLSQIAPTYVGLEPAAWTSWQDTLASFATLTGHDAEAAVADAEAELEAAFADGRDRLPGLQGATAQAPIVSDEGLGLSTWGNEVYTRLGLVLGDGQEDGGDVSWENIDSFNADVLFIGASGRASDEVRDEAYARLQGDPRYDELPAVQNGTVVYLSRNEFSATNSQTPASVIWWLDQIVPQLEESALNQSAQ